MRRPRQLLRELGAWRFAGVQLLFLGTLMQFLLAPILWSFWALPLGFAHPFAGLLGPVAIVVLTATFLFGEAVSLGVGLYATRDKAHRWLWPWLPSLHLYFLLATLAAIKALWELTVRPFYWDKTEHGRSEGRRRRRSRRRSGRSLSRRGRVEL